MHLVDQNTHAPTAASTAPSGTIAPWTSPAGCRRRWSCPSRLCNECPGNRYHGVQRMREIAEAAVRYMAKSSHADGTCDDYFPFERAMGALVFNLYQPARPTRSSGWRTTRSRPVHPPRPPPRGRKRDRRLSNHQALAARQPTTSTRSPATIAHAGSQRTASR